MATSGRRTLTAVDLFSGCGGLSLGLRRAGFRVIAAVEKDKLAADTYKKNHPDVRMFTTDIRRLSAVRLRKNLRLRPGELALLAGCPPCQGFSAVRTLNGKRRAVGHGSNMVYHFLRFVRKLKPKAVMLENVPGLAGNWRLREMERDLRRLGYQVKSKVLDAADYGVPQRRRRLILLASTLGEPHFGRPVKQRRFVRHAIGKLAPPGKSGDPCHDLRERRAPHVLALIRKIPKNGGSREALGEGAQLACHRDFNGFKDIYGRMTWDQVSPTITGGCVNPSKGRFLHPTENRAITLREAALLQGFPRNYFFSLDEGKFRVAEMIGNAFPPGFVALHARLVRKQIQQKARGHAARGR